MVWRGRVFFSEPFHQGRRVQCHECAGYQRQVVVRGRDTAEVCVQIARHFCLSGEVTLTPNPSLWVTPLSSAFEVLDHGSDTRVLGAFPCNSSFFLYHRPSHLLRIPGPFSDH
jgi:hypothetical protein